MRKYNLNKENISPIEMYHLVASGKLKRFPTNYLDKEICREIVRYIVITKLKMSRKDICKNVNVNFLTEHSIGGFRKKFNDDVSKLIEYCFDDMDIKQWELQRVRKDFWQDSNNQKDFMLWLMKKENINPKVLKDVQRINTPMIVKYGGSKARVAAGGTFNLINLVTQNAFKEWEILRFYEWTKKDAILAIKWLVEEKMKWHTDEEITNNLTASVFRQNNLGGLLQKYCNNSPIFAINLAYPKRFKKLKYSHKGA